VQLRVILYGKYGLAYSLWRTLNEHSATPFAEQMARTVGHITCHNRHTMCHSLDDDEREAFVF
jgi:hypothetical protein